MDVILFKISLIIWGLRKFFIEVYDFFKTNELNYVKIENCGKQNYLIYLKKLSWLDEMKVMIVNPNEKNFPINLMTFNQHKIKFNNVISIDLPDNLTEFKILIQYKLKMFSVFKKEYGYIERITNWSIGKLDGRTLVYKIIEE